MMWIILVMLVISYGIVGIISYMEYKEDKKKVEALGIERAELLEQMYKLCEVADLQEKLIRDLQKRIFIIEQKIEELNDKWM